MPKLDPNEQGGGEEREVHPAGRYGLAIVWFKRKRPKDPKKKEYLSIKVEITQGSRKGKTFYTMMSVDTSKSGCVTRWRLLAKACGVTRTFELGSYDEGTADQGDSEIAELFLRKPFVGIVNVEQSGQYRNNSISEIVKPEELTKEEVLENKVWATETAEDNEDFGPPPDDDDIPF